jgi:hypothetical protein
VTGGAHVDEHELEGLAAEVARQLDAGRRPGFDPETGETVVLPDAPGAGHWAGAPSVVVTEDGRALLSYRRRRPLARSGP